MEEKMENKTEFSLKINEKFDSLYKLGYFLIDLNSILNFSDKINKQNIEDAKKPKGYKFGITSRYLNKDSLDTIKLVKFEQGSLITVIIAPIIVTVVAAIIVKYINKDSDTTHPKIEITINNQTIHNIVVNNINNNTSISNNLDTVINSLKKENLLGQDSILYNSNGKELISKNIERLKGQLIDENW
jgi:hypothetical protein